MEMKGDTIEVEIGGVTFQSPVFLASGTAGYGYELAEILDMKKIGAVITKGVSPAPRDGNPPPRISEFYVHGRSIGLLNSIGLQNPGADEFARKIMPELREKLKTKVIVNVFGEKEEDYPEVIRKIEEICDEETAPDGYELNLSCPNTEKGGIEFGVNPDSVRKIVSMCRKETKKPIFVKFSPFAEILPELVRVSQEEGVNIFTLTNTIPAAVFDYKVGFFKGGLSGFPLKPIALRCVIEVKERFPDAEIIGCGGIYSADDAFEFILAGAKAVQVGTANFPNPKISEKISEELSQKIRKTGKELEEIVGSGIKKKKGKERKEEKKEL